MLRQQVAGPAEPGEERQNARSVEPGKVRSAFCEAALGDAATVMPAMKRQMPFHREMQVHGAREERQHAEREAHQKTEEIEVRPSHTTPRERHLPAFGGPRR